MADTDFTIYGSVELESNAKNNVLTELQNIITEAEKKTIKLKVVPDTKSALKSIESLNKSASKSSSKSTKSSANKSNKSSSTKSSAADIVETTTAANKATKENTNYLAKNLTQYNKLQTAIKNTETAKAKLQTTIKNATAAGISSESKYVKELTSGTNELEAREQKLKKIESLYPTRKNSKLNTKELKSSLIEYTDEQTAAVSTNNKYLYDLKKKYASATEIVTSETKKQIEANKERAKQEKKLQEQLDKEAEKAAKTDSSGVTTIEETPSVVSRLLTSIKDQIKRNISTAVAGFAVGAVKNLVTTNIELGASFADLQIVTRATNMEMETYSDTIASIAEETAISMSDLVEATTTYARLGYSAEESMTFAKYTAMLQNVGDVDATTAQNAITAIIKAYDIGYDEIVDVMDKLVLVGNNFPISPSDLAEGMNNAGSMLSVATGGNFEQSLAMLTAANTTIQNISKSSTGLRTIAARIRNVESELNDLGEEMTTVEYEELTKTLTDNAVSMTDETGTIRNLYDILKDISDQWTTLGENEKAALAKALAGTRQQNVFFSLMENFNEATGAMDAMENSAGTLEDSYANYLDTTAAHIATLKSQFEALSLSAVDSGMINTFIDMGTAIIDVTNSATKLVNTLGGLPTILGSIASISLLKNGNSSLFVKGFNSLFGAGSDGKNIGIFRSGGAISQIFTGLKSGLKTVAGSFKTAVTGIKNVKNAADEAGQSVANMGGGFKASGASIVGAITAVATIVYSIVSGIKNSIAQARQERIAAGEETLSDTQSLSDAAENYTLLFHEYSQGTATTEELTDAQKELRLSLGMTSSEFDSLLNRVDGFNNKVGTTLLTNLKELSKYLNDVAEEGSEAAKTGFFAKLFGEDSGADYFDINAYDFFAYDDYGDYGEISLIKMTDDLKKFKNAVANSSLELKENYSAFTGTNGDFKVDLGELFGYDINDPSTWKQGLEDFNTFLEEYAAEYGTTDENYNKLASAYSSFSSATKDYFSEVSKYNEELVTTAVLSEGTSISTFKAYKEMRKKLIDSLYDEDGEYYSLFNTDAGETRDEVLDSILSENELYSEWESQYQKELEQVENITEKKKEIQRVLAKNGIATHLSKGFMGGLSDEEIAELYITVTTDGISNIEELGDRIEDLKNSKDSTEILTDGFQILTDSATAATEAVTELEEVLAVDDYDEGYENRKKYLEEMQEELEKGYIGSKAMSAYKEYFGIEGSAEDVQSFIDRVSSWFEDGYAGIQNFLSDTNNAVDKSVAYWDESTGDLRFDYTKLDEWANALNVPTEMIEDMIQEFRMYTEEFSAMSSTAEQLNFYKSYGGVEQIGDTNTYIANMEKLKEITGLSSDELSELNDRIGAVEGVHFVEISTDTQTVWEAQKEFDRLYNEIYSLDINTQVGYISEYISSLASLHPSVAIELLTTLDLPENLAAQIYDILPESIQTEVDLVDGAFVEKSASVEETTDAIDSTTVTPTISADTTQFYAKANAVKNQLASINNINANPTITVTTSYTPTTQDINGITPSIGVVKGKKATGTHGSTGGLTLLGDEISPSGKPKPELVVSGDSAFLAGLNGAEVRTLSPGDIVYPYNKTKKLLGSSLFSGSIPALAKGFGSSDERFEKIQRNKTTRKKTTTTTTKTTTTVNSSYSGGSASGFSYYTGDSSSSGSGSGSGSSGSGSSDSSSSSKDEDSWFDKLYKKHQHLLNMEKESDEDYYAWLEKAWQQAYADGTLTEEEAWKYEEEVYKWKKEQLENLFKAEYELHNHKVDLTKESDQEYYTWLAKRIQSAYANGEIELSDYYKYVEEVYENGKKLISDYFDDLENLTSMFEKAGKSNVDIINFDTLGMKYAEEQIARLIKEGKNNNDEEVQDLQSTWWNFYEDKADREEEVADNARDELEDLIDFRIDMIKRELEDEKDAINERLDNLQDFYDKQRELLQQSADDEDYIEEQSEKRKTVSDLQAKLDQLELDNSASAQKRKLELLEELEEAQKELDDFEKDHALSSLQDHLDKMQEMQEAELNKEIENIETKEESAKVLREQALEDIRVGNQELLDEMLKYNDEFGDGNDFTVTTMWNEAYTALLRYKELYNEWYEDVKLTTGTDTNKKVNTSKIDAGNVTPTKPALTTVGNATIKEGEKNIAKIKSSISSSKSSSSSNSSKSSSISAGRYVKIKSSYASSAGGSYISNPYYSKGSGLYVVQPPGLTVPYKVNGTDWVFLSTKSTYSAANGVGWIKVSDLEGYASGTAYATPGLHEINEQGDEALFKSKNGSTYRLFSGGEKVFSSDATNFLYSLANNGAALFKNSSTSLSGLSSKSSSPVFNMGNIYIDGNPSNETLSELRRRRREEIDYVLKEFNKLNK